VRVLWVVFALLGGLNRGGVAHVNTVLACFLWFALQVVWGLVAWGAGGSATAYAAHGGGFLAGIAMGLAAGYPGQSRREVHRDRARSYFERGDWHAAAGELTHHLQCEPSDRDSRARLARCWAVLGRAGEAAAEYQRAFREASRARAWAELAWLVTEMHRYGVGPGLESSGLLRVAFELQKAGQVEAAALVYEEIANLAPEGPVGELALIRRAEIAWGDLGDYEQAQADYNRLLAAHPASEWRDLAEARLRSIRALTGESAPRLARGTRTRRPIAAARPPSAA
jgi:tetratricopeptide (TPR) repeat protein